MGKVLLYETTTTYFLRQTITYLSKWKSLPILHMATNQEYVEKLEDLFDSVFEMLPDYCYGVLGLLSNILHEENSWEEKLNLMNETICICQLLLKKPSIETFECFVDWNYSTLVSDERFSEDILEDIMKKAWKLQVKYESHFHNSNTIKKQNLYRKKLYENDILWIAIVRMRTATEKILLKAIRYAKLRSWNFYRFCIEIAGNPNTTEKVWLALIERIYRENFSEFSDSQLNSRKTRIITSMFQIKNPGTRVIKRTIELIMPSGKYYYDFYYGIILKCRNEKEILQDIRRKIGPQKTIIGGSKRYQEKRLHFLLNNLCS